MEEIEVPVEQSQEVIHEHAHHSKDKWIGQVALSSAFLAVFAAISALMAGHHSNEAMIEQIRASDQWSYFQAKGVKSSVLQTKLQIYEALGKPTKPEDQEKLVEYKAEQEEISHKAKELEESSEGHLAKHQTLAKAVTFFQVAIAISAIAVLVRRRKFWYLSLGFGFVGVFFSALGLL